MPNHMTPAPYHDIICGRNKISPITGGMTAVRVTYRAECTYHPGDTPTTCWPVQGSSGVLLCFDCFMDNTSCSPGRPLCTDCWTQVDDDGYCNCMDESDDEPRFDPDYDDPYEEDPPAGPEPEKEEVTDDDPDVPMNSLLFRSLANRPMRMVSFEQEIGLGGNYIAEQLHEAGFGTPDHMVNYHASHEWERIQNQPRPFVFVEEDTSVAAELVWSCMDLDTPDHAEKLATGLELIREAMKEKRVRLDMRCGGHIHVDCSDYMPKNTASCYHLGCYLEDTIFRLASANWKCHRTEIAQENYSPPIYKGALRNADALLNAGRDRTWLNFQHLLNARSQRACVCGAAAYGLWDECSCNVRQCTIEFRVFNTTANPVKLRAYIALCVGIVQYARDNDVTPDKFPVFEWSHNSGTLEMGKSLERLDFIMTQLPMEDADRKAIMYCVERSSLKPCLDAIGRKES